MDEDRSGCMQARRDDHSVWGDPIGNSKAIIRDGAFRAFDTSRFESTFRLADKGAESICRQAPRRQSPSCAVSLGPLFTGGAGGHESSRCEYTSFTNIT